MRVPRVGQGQFFTFLRISFFVLHLLMNWRGEHFMTLMFNRRGGRRRIPTIMVPSNRVTKTSLHRQGPQLTPTHFGILCFFGRRDHRYQNSYICGFVVIRHSSFGCLLPYEGAAFSSSYCGLRLLNHLHFYANIPTTNGPVQVQKHELHPRQFPPLPLR